MRAEKEEFHQEGAEDAPQENNGDESAPRSRLLKGGPPPESKPEPETTTDAPEPPVEPTDPPLPKHPYLYLEEGSRERSGTRCWLVMVERDIQKVFHGPDARQQARDWMASKFNARPTEEIEIPLDDEVPRDNEETWA